VGSLNDNGDDVASFKGTSILVDWRAENATLAPLFLNNDLRIADAHEAFGNCLSTLEKLGFDVALVNEGYGRALDFVIDGIVTAIKSLNEKLTALLLR
jgi:hypothetical protein